MDVYIGWPASTHDAHVLANSDIFIRDTLLNKPIHICGNDVLWHSLVIQPILFSLGQDGRERLISNGIELGL